MEKQELKQIWKSMKLSCRNSYKPEYIKAFYKRVGLEMPEHLIYTEKRYRELADNVPRVDGEDVLINVCVWLHIEPEQKFIELSNKMFGEGSRRQCIEEAYLGVE